MDLIHRPRYKTPLLAILACAMMAGAASGTSFDTSPRHVILLSDGARVIAQEGPKVMTLYRITDGAVVHRFPTPGWVRRIALSPDEKHLLVACSDGSLLLWEIGTGERAWLKTPAETGLKFAWDASFSGDGRRFAVGDERDAAVVFDTGTGEQVGAVLFPPGQTNIMSVALGPDGTDGFLVDLGERLYRFDLADGRPVNTGFVAAWPVRYAADGRSIAFRSNNSGAAERVSIVRIGDKLVKHDFGQFDHIGHIRAATDGGFLVSGRVGRRGAAESRCVGVRVWPDLERVEELWNLPPFQGVSERTDFHAGSQVGASTDFRFVTQVTDLRTGRVVREIDNSANYLTGYVSIPWVGMVSTDRALLWAAITAAVALVGVWRLWRRRRRR